MANSSGTVGILRALLTADTTSFDTSMRKAVGTTEKTTTAITGLGAAVQKLTPQAERMVKSFSGERLTSTANNLVAAVAKIGGVSKLTATEQARVNTTITDAIAKYAALGKVAPQAMLDLEKATRKVLPPTADLGKTTSQLSTVMNQLAGLFTVRAIVNFGERVIAAGDRIQKMSDQTGLATDEVQRFDFIAGQTGTTVESLIGAVQNLQQRLGDDSTGAAGAFARLKINADEFNKLGTYQQMLTLATALRGITDPTDQASIAAALFGKTWKEILPAIKSDMAALGAQAPIMADETVKSLDRIGDALTRAKQQWLIWGGGVAEAIEKVGFFLGGGFGAELTMRKFAEENDPTGLGRALGKIPPVAEQAARGLKTLSLSAEEAERIEKKLTASAKESIAEHEKLAAALQRLVDVRNRAFGLDAVASATELLKAIGGLEGTAHMSAAAMADLNRLMNEAIDASKRAGRDVPVEWSRVLESTRDNIGSLQEYLKLVQQLPESMREIPPPPELIPTSALDAERLRNKLLGVAPNVTQDRAVDDRLAKRAEAYKRLGESIKQSLGGIDRATFGNLGTLVFGLGHDPTGDLHRAAEAAKQDWLRLRRSGRATAEELQLSFKRFHDAENLANFSAGEKFKEVWRGVSRELVNILNDLLGFYTRQFLGGLIKGIAGAHLGDRLAQSLLTATAAEGARRGIPLIPLPGGGAPGDARPNPPTKAPPKAPGIVPIPPPQPGEGPPTRSPIAVASVGRPRQFEALAAGMRMASMGRPVESFNFGGFVPPNVIQPAILHGPEWVIPGDQMAAAQRPNVELHQHYSTTFQSQSFDADGAKRIFERDFLPRLHAEYKSNQRDTITLLEKVLQR